MNRGVVAAGDPVTAQAGATLLRAGANAVDACIAAAMTSFVAEPLLASAGGAGVAICGSANDGYEVHDFFTIAPGKGLTTRPDLDFHPITIDFGPASQEFQVGRGAAAVPTILFGLLELHRRRGKADLSDVLAPAIAAARDGVVFTPSIRFVVKMLRPIVSVSPQVEALLSANGMVGGATDGTAARDGAPVANRALAAFLEQLSRDGESLLRGAFTDAVVNQFGPSQGGLLTRDDLETFRPTVRRPLSVPFGDFTLLTNPPPSSGGALVGIGLRAAVAGQLGRHPFLSPEHVVELAQVLKTVSVARRTEIDERVAKAVAGNAANSGNSGVFSDVFGDVFSDDDIRRWRATADGEGEERNLGGTTHISVLDADGQAAAMTLTNGEGCGHALDGMGVHINNFLGEEDINPGGFHKLSAGARMPTMMAPSIVLKNGRPALVAGSGGSNRIRSAIVQAVAHATLSDQPLEAAVRAPRLHVEGQQLWFEREGLSAAAAEAIYRKFPDASAFPQRSMFFGGVHCVGPNGAAGDARRGGVVVKL